MVDQGLWEEGEVEDVVLEDYFHTAAIKYDLYLGDLFLTKNKVAPVGHRRCFILEFGETEAPSFRFLHSGYRSAKYFLSRKVNTVFGEDEGSSEVSATASYSILLQERRRETQRPKARYLKSSNYRVVDKWPGYICSYFLENHDFVPARDAFCNELNKPFKRLADDEWAVKWDKRLWINPPFYLLGEVVQKRKGDRTQAILIVPLWDSKPWWKDVLAMTVDSIRLPHHVKPYARDDTGPLQQRPWPTVAFLVDGGPMSDGSCTSDHWSESGLDHGTESDSNFSDFLERDDTVPNLESGRSDCSQTPIRSDPASISHLARGEKFQKQVKFRQFYERPKLEAFLDPFVCEDVEDAQQVHASTTYPQDGVEPSLFQSLKQGLLPAGSRDLAKICSTVVAGEQVERQLCKERRQKIFAERKDTTLSGKLLKNPRVCGLHGEAFIELKEGAKPKKQRPYENHGKKHEILRDIIQRNLREFGWLEACVTSEWCCAPFTVPKPPPADQISIDGWRMVVNFRNLNAETKADSHPLPLIEEEIVKRAKGKFFSVLDLRHGFHQMPLAKSSRPMTCMCSPVGPVQCTVMPMGLKNALSFFQRMMEEVLVSEHPELREFVSVYIDDIIIATVGDGLTEQEPVDLHEKQLNIHLGILDRNQLICGPKKGKLFLESVEFCGSLLRNKTRQPSPGKLLAIQKWKRSETISALRGFLGCCNCYHTFVKNYAKYAAPLTELLKVGREAGRAGSKVRVQWTDECDEAFVQLKAALCEVGTLHVPKFDRPFYIRTDASKYAVGAVLEQQDFETGAHYLLAFRSRKLSPRQMQWSPREQGNYAIICAFKKYQSCVGTNRVEVLTDHRSMEYWSTEHVNTVSGPAGRRARWHEFFSIFDLHVAYLPCKYNTVADALSRSAYPASEACLSRNIHGTEQDRGLVIEWDAEKRQLIKRHCLQCSVQQGRLPCHDITVEGHPAHSHVQCSAVRVHTLRVVKPGESNPQFVNRRNPVVRFRCVHPLGRKPVAPAQAIPKDSLITKDWSEEYKSDNMFQEIYEYLTSKSAFQDGIYSEYFFDNGKLWMTGKSCMPDRLASRVVNWWHNWETAHSHGAKLTKSIKHRLFGARLHTHCMKVTSSCAQCAVAVPATAEPKSLISSTSVNWRDRNGIGPIKKSMVCC